MIDRLVEFNRLLRQAGVRVSLAESQEAAQVLEWVDLADRAQVKGALQAVLVKRPDDAPVFAALFDSFFKVRLASGQGEGSPRVESSSEEGAPGGGPPREEGVGSRTPEAEDSQGSCAGGEDPQAGDDGGEAPSQERKDGEESGDEEADRALRLLAKIQLGSTAGAQNAQALRAARQTQADDLGTMDLQGELPPGQVEDLYGAVGDLAAQLATRQARRYRRTRTGPVDFKHTVRQSFKTGGLPFYVPRRQRRLNKHALVVLCDVSGSVWRVARFFLKLAHTMQDQFSRTRSFLFVDRICEVTSRWEGEEFAQVVEGLRADPGLNIMGRSDFGRAFYQFYNDCLPTLPRDTVLVVLGDARSNHFEPLAWTLDEIQQATRRVIWLNPEPRRDWDRDDSVMAAYRPFCDHVLECRNLAHLQAAGRLLLERT